MELSNQTPSFNLFQQLSQVAKNFLDPFIHQLPDDVEGASMIMPLEEIMNELNQAYLEQAVTLLTFEQYDDQGQLELLTLPVVIQSPARLDQPVAVRFLETDRTMTVSLKQILTLTYDPLTV